MIGERVRLAREACCLTQQQLAAAAEITQASLSSIEAGRVLSPSATTVEKIAGATQFPTAFFYLGPLPDLPEGNYRRRMNASSKDDRQLRAQVRQIVEFVQRSEQMLKLPKVTIPIFDAPLDLTGIETAAAAVRQALGVGARDPIPNLTRAVERAGVMVVRLPMDMERRDGYSVWPDGRPIIALTPGHPGDRDRFNVAHELGHLVLHTTRQGLERVQAEQEANNFAGALLLPLHSAVAALRPPITLRVLMAVKATYGISIAATAQRALGLKLISHAQFVSIRKQLSARQWTKVEPIDVPQEKPLLMPKVIDALAGQGSTSQRAERICMPVFAFRALATA